MNNDTLQNIRNIRLQSQQLVNQRFTDPASLVEWMGAIQAQDYNMAKWAIGCRLISSTDQMIEDAFNRGDILRTHVMRPTWHFVTKEDIRWMAELSSKKIISAWKSYNKKYNADEKEFMKYVELIGKFLEGNRHLTREEIKQELEKKGVIITPHEVNHYLMHAEALGIVCSGIIKNKKHTYALLDERIPKTENITKEDALFRIATKYFRSHSPATIDDFMWWSGLSTSNAKNAIDSIKSNLITETYDNKQLYIYDSSIYSKTLNESYQLLPSFDEYLISYRYRYHVLDLEHYSKAFNNFGTFYPVLAHNGNIVGNWKKEIKKNDITLNTELFNNDIIINQDLIKTKHNSYNYFLSKLK